MKISRNKIRYILVVLLSFGSAVAFAQRIAVHTNVMSLATLSPNAGLEVTLSNRVSLLTSVSFNPWQDEKWQARHLSISTEVRYWLARPSISHFITMGPMAATYDLNISEKSYKGDMFALGVGYGYALALGRRWNFEPEIMIGYGCLREYSSGGKQFESPRVRWTPMVTRVGVSFVYVIK